VRPRPRPRPESARPRSRPRPRPRPKTTRTKPRPVQSSQLHVIVTQIGMFYFFITHEVNDKPEIDFAFKMINK